MTKRDVAVWFCRVWALAELIGAAFSLTGNLMSWILPIGAGGRGGFGNFPYSLPHLALAVFLWLFAVGIGTELAAEGEHGLPIASVGDLKPLLLRCVGLAAFLSSTSTLAVTLLQLGIFHFSPSPGLPTGLIRFYVISAISSALQATVGFLFAFTPRLRQFLGK